MLTRLDLNLLVALEALLDEQNVTRAGNRVGLSQPAMSAALRRLRIYFDDDLLVRVGRNYELTPFALELTEPLRETLATFTNLIERRASFDPGSANIQFRIRLSDYAMHILLRPLVRCLAIEAPGVAFHFLPLEFDVPPSEVMRSVDLLVAPEGPENVSYGIVGERARLFSDRWMIAADTAHPELGDSISIEQLSTLPVVQYQLANGAPSTADLALDALGVTRRAHVTVGDFVAAMVLLEGTNFITLTPERLGRLFEHAAHVKLLPPPCSTPDIVECMWWHPSKSGSPSHRWLRHTVADVAAALPQPPSG